MSERIATVRFPDGTHRYAVYSTFDQLLRLQLYQNVTAHDGRSRPAGPPFPTQPDAPRPLVEQLVPITVAVEDQALSWTALWCPNRLFIVGPLSPYHGSELQDDFELTSEGQLREPGDLTALCGRPAPGEEQPFHRLTVIGGTPDGVPEVPDVDLFGGWPHQPACLECLMATLRPPSGRW